MPVSQRVPQRFGLSGRGKEKTIGDLESSQSSVPYPPTHSVPFQTQPRTLSSSMSLNNTISRVSFSSTSFHPLPEGTFTSSGPTDVKPNFGKICAPTLALGCRCWDCCRLRMCTCFAQTTMRSNQLAVLQLLPLTPIMKNGSPVTAVFNSTARSRKNVLTTPCLHVELGILAAI